ncbi:hypothetical protein C7B67_17355 [filamentous cyanobacterium Phorm 6]|nr:hypothetical protein C7B67_17355 [filamentous cyanobacterium Phorm 6]
MLYLSEKLFVCFILLIYHLFLEVQALATKLYKGRKKEEGRRKKEEGRRKKEEGRRKKEDNPLGV